MEHAPDELTRTGVLRILSFTTLYPNAVRPQHGIFVEQRLRHLLASGEAKARVVAPVPWFPFKFPAFRRYSDFAAVPAHEVRHGIEVDHPRYPVIPWVGMTAAPSLMTWSVMAHVKRLHARHRFDLIDAHYFYPDGVAAVRLGRRLGLPVVITARGSDINLIPQYRHARRLITSSARQASALITVSEALKEKLAALDVPATRITTLRNGVDLDRFRPLERAPLRKKLGLEGTVLLSVGHLAHLKGHDLVLEALRSLPGATLVVIGEGPLKAALRRQAKRKGIAERVHFWGAVSHDHLVEYYNAADVLVLASSREGMPNVVLESLACGTPVVATNVGGIPEVIAAPAAGRIVQRRDSADIADAVKALLRNPPEKQTTRQHALNFSWEGTTAGQLTLFRRLAGRSDMEEAGAGPAHAVSEAAHGSKERRRP